MGKELGSSEGTVQRVVVQLGRGVESVRSSVTQAAIDAGEVPGTSSEDADELKASCQEIKELRRTNEILKK